MSIMLVFLLVSCGGREPDENDTVGPVITPVGDNPMNVEQGGQDYIDPGVDAVDAVDGVVSVSITGTRLVDMATVGTYTITYTARDVSGNVTVATRTVNVVDVTAPVITLNGAAMVDVKQGQNYIDPGATATDVEDENVSVTMEITKEGIVVASVDTSTIGDAYTLTYSASDIVGNVATATRIVTIIEASSVRPINDTGITWGANSPSGNNTDCTGETIGEQDCSHGRDANETLTKVGGGDAGFDFTKLDASGNSLDANATNWSCVKDNYTGLIWEVKTDAERGRDQHSKYDSYSWYSTTNNDGNAGSNGPNSGNHTVCTGYDVNDTATYCNTESFIARVNASNNGNGLCGATDWRLPNLNELQSIVHLGRNHPAIDTNYFPNSQSSFYWSSTPVTDGNVSSVYFAYGSGLSHLRNTNLSVRLVRGR